MNNKKTEYSNSLVYMVIFLLALPIVVPPFFRVMFPAEDTSTVVDNKRTYLICSKIAGASEGYNVSSSTLYEGDIPIKNNINFYFVNAIPSTEERVEIDSALETQTEEVVVEGVPEVQYDQSVEGDGTTDEQEGSAPTPGRTVQQEIDFFKSLEGVFFQQTEKAISLEINQESIQLNSNNLELSNYLSELESQQKFYTDLGYGCYTEDA